MALSITLGQYLARSKWYLLIVMMVTIPFPADQFFLPPRPLHEDIVILLGFITAFTSLITELRHSCSVNVSHPDCFSWKEQWGGESERLELMCTTSTSYEGCVCASHRKLLHWYRKQTWNQINDCLRISTNCRETDMSLHRAGSVVKISFLEE